MFIFIFWNNLTTVIFRTYNQMLRRERRWTETLTVWTRSRWITVFAAVKAECVKTLRAVVPKKPNKEQPNFTKLDNYNMNKVWDFLILRSVLRSVQGGNPSARAPSDPGVVTDAVRSVTLQHAVSTQRVRLSRSVMTSTCSEGNLYLFWECFYTINSVNEIKNSVNGTPDSGWL